MRRPPEVQRVFNHLGRADRTFRKAMDRLVEVDSTVGLRRGHLIEARRRVMAYRDELDRFIAQLAQDQDAS